MRIEAQYVMSDSQYNSFSKLEKFEKMLRNEIIAGLIGEADKRKMLELKQRNSEFREEKIYTMACFMFSEKRMNEIFQMLLELKESKYINDIARRDVIEILDNLRH